MRRWEHLVTSPTAAHRINRDRTRVPNVTSEHHARHLMARHKTGSVFEKPWANGETVSFGAWVYAYGQREKVTFGTNKQGWNRTRAELETEKIVQQIERGTWVPPRLEPREDRVRDAMSQLGLQLDEMFRTFLEIDEFHDLLAAAGELEAEARADRKGVGRRAMCAKLGLAGYRISEMLDLLVAQVDLARSRFKPADANTEAGVREAEMTLYLRDELLEYVMDRRARGLPMAPSDHFFGTGSGRRRDSDRVPSRQITRYADGDPRGRAEIPKGAFDQLLDDLDRGHQSGE